MYAGKIIEIGTAEEVYYDPRHPYTWGLLSSLPVFAGEKGELNPIPGMPPSLWILRREMRLPFEIPRRWQSIMNRLLRCLKSVIRIMQPHGFWMKELQNRNASILKDRLQENSGRKQKPDKKEASFLQKTEQKQAPVLIEARNLKQHFRIRSDYTIHAVDDVSFSIREGEIMALVVRPAAEIHDSQNACRNLPAYRRGDLYQGERVPDKGSFRNAEENAD